MGRRTRLPMFVIAASLFGLIAVLATLQYRWLGQISDAERDRMRAAMTADASSFAEDFDRELTRAYLLFQVDPSQDQPLAARVAARYDRWTATARFPRIIRDVYVVSDAAHDRPARYDPATRTMEPTAWPDALRPIAEELTPRAPPAADPLTVRLVHTLPPTVWVQVPALVVPIPMIVMAHGGGAPIGLTLQPQLSYAVLQLDATYIDHALLPALAEQHFQARGDAGYQLAVVSSDNQAVVYTSHASSTPATAKADASVDLFRVRTQDFAALASEVSRVGALAAVVPKPDGQRQTIVRETMTAFAPSSDAAGGHPFSIVVQSAGQLPVSSVDKFVGTTTTDRTYVRTTPHWILQVHHPAGSLERAVQATRRRNLLISSSILGILGLSVAFLVVSTRRAQDLARQQIEFVATVSHELRTPLAVIRSAADNLADGVVGEADRVRAYGQLVRREGVRLSDLVEQILEFAGLQSGQRALHVRAVPIAPLLREVVAAATGQAAAAGISMELSIANDLPAAAGDPDALRRVFQNLLGNAIKYGASGGWIGITVQAIDQEIHIAVADRGIGIDDVDHSRIFEPFFRAPSVVAAQVQGAGLGLTLVRRIVDAHHGRIAVVSAAGRGSAFTVTLPAAADAPPPGSAAAAEASATAAKP